MTRPMMIRQIRQAMMICTSELVGFMNSSRVQLFWSLSGAKMISWELGIMGVHTLIDLVAPIEKAAVKVST